MQTIFFPQHGRPASQLVLKGGGVGGPKLR